MADVNEMSAKSETKPGNEPSPDVAAEELSEQHIKNLRGVIAWLRKTKHGSPLDEVQGILNATQKESWQKIIAVIKEYPQTLESLSVLAEYQKELVNRGTFVPLKPSRKRRTKEEIEAAKTDKAAKVAEVTPPTNHQGGMTDADNAVYAANAAGFTPPSNYQGGVIGADNTVYAANAAGFTPTPNYQGGR